LLLCSYIPSASDLIIFEHHLSAIKSVLSLLSNRDLLIVLGDFNLPDISLSRPTDSFVAIPLSVNDFVGGLRELSLQQVSLIRNSLNRQLDLVFVSDPSEVTISRIDALVVPEDRYHPITSVYKKIDEKRLSGNLSFPVRYISLIKKRALKIFSMVPIFFKCKKHFSNFFSF